MESAATLPSRNTGVYGCNPAAHWSVNGGCLSRWPYNSTVLGWRQQSTQPINQSSISHISDTNKPISSSSSSCSSERYTLVISSASRRNLDEHQGRSTRDVNDLEMEVGNVLLAHPARQELDRLLLKAIGLTNQPTNETHQYLTPLLIDRLDTRTLHSGSK